MLNTAQSRLASPVYLSDWTMNSVISMTYFQKEKHFLKYTVVKENEAAYGFDPPVACNAPGYPDRISPLLQQQVGFQPSRRSHH